MVAVKTAKRRRRLDGNDIIEQINARVMDLIKENRRLKRQVVKLSMKGSKRDAGNVKRGLRTIQSRLERALAVKPRRRRTVPANGRRKSSAGRRKLSG